MGTLNEDLTAIKTIEDGLVGNKVAKFAYTDLAYCCNCVAGVETYDANNEQNIPVGTASIMKVNDTVLNKGYRAQASSVTRMLLNHFLGRLSYNLNKVNDNVANLLNTLISHRGTANGLATLDANAKVPNSEIPLNIVRTVNGVGTADGAVIITYSDIGLSSTAGCPLGTASAGTMTTPARADHVHSMPSRIDLGFGTAVLCNADCFRASTWTPTCVECAGQAIGTQPFNAQAWITNSGETRRATAIAMVGNSWGYTTRIALGVKFDGETTGCGYSSGVLSVGCDDSGSSWNDFYFRQGAGGDVVTSTTIRGYCVACADCANCADYANCANCADYANCANCADCASYALRAGYSNFGGITPYEAVVSSGWVFRQPLVCSVILGEGFTSRMAIGQRRVSGWGDTLISVGCDDSGSLWHDYIFSATGTVYGFTYLVGASVDCATCATKAQEAYISASIRMCSVSSSSSCSVYYDSEYGLIRNNSTRAILLIVDNSSRILPAQSNTAVGQPSGYTAYIPIDFGTQ